MKFNQDKTSQFLEKLNAHYAWPALYTFKFIVPENRKDALINMFPKHVPSVRTSKNGNYSSLTFEMMLPSGDAVIEVYQAASKIEGIIAL